MSPLQTFMIAPKDGVSARCFMSGKLAFADALKADGSSVTGDSIASQERPFVAPAPDLQVSSNWVRQKPAARPMNSKGIRT